MSDSLWPSGYSPWNSLGQNTEVGCHASSRESSQPRDQTQVSHIAGDSLPAESPGKPKNTRMGWVQFSSVSQSHLTLRLHGLQHARPPCPSPTPRAYSNSCPLSQWCHPTISSSVVPFSSRLLQEDFSTVPVFWEITFCLKSRCGNGYFNVMF